MAKQIELVGFGTTVHLVILGEGYNCKRDSSYPKIGELSQ